MRPARCQPTNLHLTPDGTAVMARRRAIGFGVPQTESIASPGRMRFRESATGTNLLQAQEGASWGSSVGLVVPGVLHLASGMFDIQRSPLRQKRADYPHPSALAGAHDRSAFQRAPAVLPACPSAGQPDSLRWENTKSALKPRPSTL